MRNSDFYVRPDGKRVIVEINIDEDRVDLRRTVHNRWPDGPNEMPVWDPAGDELQKFSLERSDIELIVKLLAEHVLDKWLISKEQYRKVAWPQRSDF